MKASASGAAAGRHLWALLPGGECPHAARDRAGIVYLPLAGRTARRAPLVRVGEERGSTFFLALPHEGEAAAPA